MYTYLFQLGSHPEISMAELRVFFSFAVSIEKKNDLYAEVTIQTPLDCTAVLRKLGGSISVAEHLPNLSPTISALADYLESVQSVGKVTFCVLAKQKSTQLALGIKKELRSRGRAVRYVPAGNSATIIHNKLVEKSGLIQLYAGNVYVSRAVQPIQEQSERDYNRPKTDSLRGMLPPKLTRMMINIAGVNEDARLYDPFCGIGTVLTEAITMGVQTLYGTDLSETAVANTKENIAWCKKTFAPEQQPDITVKTADATSLSPSIQDWKVTHIVTEPYMGQLLTGRERKSHIEKNAASLRDLYEQALLSLQRVCPASTVVMIFPTLFWRDIPFITIPESFFHKELATIFPLTEKTPYARYRRAGQHLARDIWKFRLS